MVWPLCRLEGHKLSSYWVDKRIGPVRNAQDMGCQSNRHWCRFDTRFNISYEVVACLDAFQTARNAGRLRNPVWEDSSKKSDELVLSIDRIGYLYTVINDLLFCSEQKDPPATCSLGSLLPARLAICQYAANTGRSCGDVVELVCWMELPSVGSPGE